MNNFQVRAISGIVYAAIFIFSILYSQESYIGLIGLFGSICLWEFSKIINLKGLIINILIFISLIILSYTKAFPIDKIGYLLAFCILFLLFLIIDLYAKKVYQKTEVIKSFITLSYIILPFLFLAFLPILNNTYHPKLIIFVILIIWANDSFAYIVGKNFGKTKLFERISPKKTIEGFLGGFIFAILTGIVISKYSVLFSTINWIIIAAIISVFGTYGDLIESKFKRLANVKDSGTIMPGHGGLLDRLDSLFFLAPFVYLYIHYLL